MAAVDIDRVELGFDGRPAEQVLIDCRELIDPAMRVAVDGLPDSMRQIAGYHLGWWNPDGQPSNRPSGKAFRPALVLLTAEAVGGDVADAIPAAIAVELVHNFSILHDDVLDGDTTRRHRPTAWAVFGRPAAILAGNALLSLAFDVLAADSGQVARHGARRLGAAVLDLLDGQHADLGFEQRADVELPECVRMAERKSAALLACCCALGGSFGGADPERVERLRDLGMRLGLAFQLVDDLLGIWGDPAVTGKPVYSDLSSRKKTLPVVAAMTSGTAAGDELGDLYARAELSDAELAHAAQLIELAGARKWTQTYADELLDGVLCELASVGQVSTATAELSDLARLVTRRDR